MTGRFCFHSETGGVAGYVSLPRGAEGLPVTDLAATFVLWADSGFPHEPTTLSEKISFVKSFETCDDFLDEKGGWS